MILPEDRASIIQKAIEEECYFARPKIDQDKLAEMSETIGPAMTEGGMVTMQVYEQYGSYSVTMLPKKFDEVNRSLVGLSQLGEERVRIALEDIIDVEAERGPA